MVGLEQAVAHLRGSGLLILPTDTVYGIGATASDADAVTALLAAKGRGRQMPPPVLVASAAQLDGVVAQVPAAATALMQAFWPGALTLVLDAHPQLGWELGETGGTIAVRMPNHPLALALLERTGPLAVTSANRTGESPATDAAGATAAFPGRVTRADAASATTADILLLDGGPTPGPLPSTIVSLAGEQAQTPVFLRDGVLSRQQVLAVVNAATSAATSATREVPAP
ncbi:tRNA(ANN) t(6)A37 threonylcarbamoyladenosine modification protein [Actinomyces bovis]|uniref:L-threonylcarbamoyladenylate synthase n=1 Tax=Actinomyces bovis TaxID=1658 RepID=A0ABY1VL29_9ACTO|nr:L-threonylcarbamoyladenylate synthase [Actinomyces bovis]SPT52804.1 tRNA(ANN) t(6)A37 threonylcarbamoyladenosine modification protein [Actinomyces bovis]VEG54847.1 tRNA(ANN) t(6)A37 threonylcarbamoyladenosine modification protein [Actinomyces israelii]